MINIIIAAILTPSVCSSVWLVRFCERRLARYETKLGI